LIKRIIFTALFVFVSAAGAFADDIFFPTKKGTVLLMATMDAQGTGVPKLVGYGRTKVLDVKGSGNNLTIVCQTEVLDKNRQSNKDVLPLEYTMRIVDGAVVVDINSMLGLPPSAVGAVVFSGDTLRIPSKVKPGDKLKDANMTMTMDMGGMKMKVDISVSNYKCLAVEKVTVPAGTFEAYKMTQTITTTNSLVQMKQTTNVVSWNVFGIGPVKNEVYDEKGKVQSRMELQEITR